MRRVKLRLTFALFGCAVLLSLFASAAKAFDTRTDVTQGTWADVIEKVSPTVVTVLSEAATNLYNRTEKTALGSGVINNAEQGHIVTNAHVVEATGAITVLLAPQVLAYGEVRRGMLGILGREVTPGLVEALKLKVTQGAFVFEAQQDSAADKAGIQPGDVIVATDDQPVTNFLAMLGRLAVMGAGTPVKLSIARGDTGMTVPVVLTGQNMAELAGEKLHWALAGANLMVVQADLDVNHVRIAAVKPNSLAAVQGLRAGDVIVEVNKQVVSNLRQLGDALDVSAKTVALAVLRGERYFYLLFPRDRLDD